MPLLRHGVFLLLSGLALSEARAGDWPQILGPNRTGIAVREKLAATWPATGPKLVWEKKVGSGFAGVVVHGEHAVLFHRTGENDQLTAYSATTGKERWTESFPTTFQPAIVEDDGPRATPVIHDGTIYAFAANGDLHAVDLQSGKKQWTRRTHRDFKAPAGYFGAGNSPIVVGDLVIANIGGDREKAGLVGFDRRTGESRWTAATEQASYSTPILVTIGNEELLLAICRLNVVLVEPASGKERGRIPFGQRGPTVNAAAPVMLVDKAFLTASYGIGSALIDVGPNGLREVYRDEDLLASQYTTPILHNGKLFGVHGRQDGGPVSLRCVDPQSRKVLWDQKLPGYATLIAAGDKLLVQETSGRLRLVELNDAKFVELAVTPLMTGTCRALPALANGLLYIRNERELKCFDLR